MSENIREIALDSMIEIMENARFCNSVISDVLTKYQYLDKKDRAFYTRLIQGTLEKLIYLDYVIDAVSKIKVRKMKPFIRNDIRLAVYQIIFMDSVPSRAACNEAVSLAKKRGFGGLGGFVNGVLRNISRKYKDIALPDKSDDYTKYLSVRYSIPEWMIDMWLEQYGDDITLKMLESFNERKAIKIRTAADVTTTEGKAVLDEIKASLESQNVMAGDGTYVAEALRLDNVDHVAALKVFKSGLIYVQDESSQLVAHAAGIKPGDVVLDLCAAPGGKSLHAAQLLKGTGKVIARDVSEDKVNKIDDNAQRCGCTNIVTQVFDATALDEEMQGAADVVLADVPCSGLGVIGQKADIRYKTSPEDIDSLVSLQRQILKNAVKYVKPGGTMIFSTCTVNEYENGQNVEWIKENSDLLPDSLDEYIPEILRSEDTREGMLRLFPGINDSDGFFIARFIRKKEE